MQKTADKFKLAVPASVGEWVRKFVGEFRTPVMNKSPKKPKTETPLILTRAWQNVVMLAKHQTPNLTFQIFPIKYCHRLFIKLITKAG